MTIPTLPSAPLVTDIPTDFNTKAFAWTAALVNWTTEANATGVAADADAAAASVSAGTATTQAGIATTQAGNASTSASTATTQAGIATTQAGIATTKAAEAAASAASVDITTTSTSTLTNKTLSFGSNTFSGTTAQFNTALSDGDFATLAGTETLTNKTLTNPVFTGVFAVDSGTASLPSITVTGDTNTGIWFPAADTIAISTAGVERISVGSTGNVAIGATPVAESCFTIRKNITGGTYSYAYDVDTTIQSDVTNAAYGFSTWLRTAASAFTLANLYHYSSGQASLGGGSTIANQMGFAAESSMTGATSNFGFHSNIAAAANRWNFYASGTAANYFAGVCQFADGAAALPSITNIGDENTGIWFPAADTIAISTAGTEWLRMNSTGETGIGAFPVTGVAISIRKNLTGATTCYGVEVDAQVQSGVTTAAKIFSTYIDTQATAFTLGSLRHFYADQASIGAGSVVSFQYGFRASDSLTGATNNYGFHAGMASSANRWNFYASGTANNAYAGNSSFGKVTAPTVSVDATSFGTNLVTNTAATYTVLTTDGTIVQTTAASTYTLPTASSFPGRMLHLLTQFAGTVISASSNVVPIAGGAAGTAILAATAGKYATLQSNGTNWLIIAAN